jgi:arylsulfatase A-like enzyme
MLGFGQHAATILKLLGIDLSPQFRGRPVFPGHEVNEADGKYSFVFTTWSMPGGAIREKGKKYIFLSEQGKEEFYDLENDPNEFHNLASEESEAMLEMKVKYNNFVSEIGNESFTLKESVSEVPDSLREKLEKLGYLNK